MTVYEDLLKLPSTEIVRRYNELKTERNALVVKTGQSLASAEDLNRYVAIRRLMQPLHQQLVFRGYDIRYNEDIVK